MKNRQLSLWEAVSIAVGTMIGAGIFSILGVGAKIAGSNLPLAFIIAGLVAYLVAYSYAKLGSTFISNAGPIEFIIRGIGDNVLTGTLSILMWFSYVISISLFAKAFAGYLLALLRFPITSLGMALVEALVIAFFTALNFFGSKAVGKAEFFIVLAKLSVLGTFVVFGVWSVKPEFLYPSLDPVSLRHTIFASSVIFLTYMGFGLITNASENMEDPKKNVPRAIYLSLAIVSVMYVSIAIVAQGNLGPEGLIRAKEYALAEAAKPFLGEIGFTFVAIGALFSTASAINATLYGGANVAYALAKKGKLPQHFERKVWFGSIEGLYITAGFGLFFVLFFNLEGIASLISFVFLVIYLFVIYSHYRLAPITKGNRSLIVLSFVAVSSVILGLLIYQYSAQRKAFLTSLMIFLLSLSFEFVYKKITGRSFSKRSVG